MPLTFVLLSLFSKFIWMFVARSHFPGLATITIFYSSLMIFHVISRWCLSTKSHAVSAIKDFFQVVSTQFHSTITQLHKDNGIEYGEAALLNLLAHTGCKLVQSATYHHSQNRIGKSALGLITEKACAMVIGSHLPTFLWTKVILAFCLSCQSYTDLS